MREKKTVQPTGGGTVAGLLFLAAVHVGLCVLYYYTYYSPAFGFHERFEGVGFWAMLIGAFLFGPLCYYLAGRLFTHRVLKKPYAITVFVVFGAIALLGVCSTFFQWLKPLYRLINAPSFLYYELFTGDVYYIVVPTMLLSGLFPAIFSRMGAWKKHRTDNSISMEEVEEIREKAEEERAEGKGNVI